MVNAIAESLYRVAGRKAGEGLGWDALNAQMAADALVITSGMEQYPDALLDIGPLNGLKLADPALPEVVQAFRDQLLKGLESWGIAGDVGAALPVISVAGTVLDPGTAGDFAAGWLAGRNFATFAAAEAARAARFAALAGRMYTAGDHLAAARSIQAADKATLGAHYGAEAAETGDLLLAALRTGLLLAEELLSRQGKTVDVAEAARAARRTHDEANLTTKPIHWEPVSFLT